MRKDKPSRTAYKVALNIVTLGAKPGMDRILPPGIVQATEKLLAASGAAEARTVRWSRSQRMVSVYEAFDPKSLAYSWKKQAGQMLLSRWG